MPLADTVTAENGRVRIGDTEGGGHIIFDRTSVEVIPEIGDSVVYPFRCLMGFDVVLSTDFRRSSSRVMEALLRHVPVRPIYIDRFRGRYLSVFVAMPSDGATVTLGRIAEWPRRWEARVVRAVISDLCQRRRLDLVAESDLLLRALQSCQSPLASLAERRARKLVKAYADGGT